MSGVTTKEVKPDAFYSVDVSGENIRVYEWTTQSGAKAIKCIVVFSSNKMNTQCISTK